MDDKNVQKLRAQSLVRRLLAGAGRLSLRPYANPGLSDLEVLGHRWSNRHGELLVAVVGPEGLEWPEPGRVVNLGVQIDKHAVLPEARLLAGSMHALGQLRFLDPDEVAALHPCELGVLAECLNGDLVRMAMVRTNRILLHAGGQVQSFAEPMTGIGGEFPTTGEEFAAAELVLAHGEAALCRLAEAVVDGRWPGGSVPISDRVPCPHLRERAFLTDLTSSTLTMFLTAEAGSILVTAELGAQAHSLAELEVALEATFWAGALS